MARASFRICFSAALKVGICLLLCSCGSARFDSNEFSISVKPERQNSVECYPVSPARLDQPRSNYPREIGRKPMGGMK